LETPLPHTEALTIQYAIGVVVAPFVAFLINFLFAGKQGKFSVWVSTIGIAFSFGLSVVVFAQVWNKPLTAPAQYLWFTVGQTPLYIGLWLNNLSVLMLLLVTAVALPVHLFSINYMKGDDRFARYFSYLSFFCFAMLALVVMNNLLLLYAFWELVGFASYLLIGFWFTRQKAVQANKKAFIMNRIGDIALLAGILLIFSHYHTFDLFRLFGPAGLANAHGANSAWLTLPGLCFLGGAMAKSAQFPLHTWLPDAMEGPTSVSALIHAATMVAAGIFLLGRVYPLFTPGVLNVMAVIGCFTAFMAATIALTQNDLKRILAYSTISQLGYMMLAMGIGAYSSALFHLATHAFFKCLLFLCAGVVIHEMHHQKNANALDIDHQNILNMGGLRKQMPVTFITCLIASAALIGLPFTSGYLSKDGILIQAFEWATNKSAIYMLIPVAAIITSLLTAFYITRLLVKVFMGQSRLAQYKPDIKLDLHDGNWLYKLPMVLLALCCLFPLFAFNPFLYQRAWLFLGFNTAGALERASLVHAIIPVSVVTLSILVCCLAFSVYNNPNTTWFKPQDLLYRLSFNQWYIDKFYTQVLIKAVVLVSSAVYWFDCKVIDGLVNGAGRMSLVLARLTALTDQYIVDGFLHSVAAFVRQVGNFIRGFQTGRVQGYLLTSLFIILIVYILKIFVY
jgi:NADH-quinone oxidoreductase subunit L